MSNEERELRIELYNRYGVMTIDQLLDLLKTNLTDLEREYVDCMIASKTRIAADFKANRW